MDEWPKTEHVATSWMVSSWPSAGRRIGTRYIYEHQLAEQMHEKGFRWRPKYLAHLKTLRDPPTRSRSDERT